MGKFIRIENETGLVNNTKIIDTEGYINELESLRISIDQVSDHMKLWRQAYDKHYKVNSIWEKLFRGLAKGFLSL